MNKENPYSVGQLSLLIKETIEGEPNLQSIFVRGEISNFKIYPSGHAYFSLKDADSVISSVMWASYASSLSFEPKDGDEVIVFGRVTTFPGRGSYQLAVRTLELYGEGDELKKLKELAEKLKKEGLFDESRKRPLPKFPKTLGVIAGKGSAGLADIIHNVSIRYPLVTIKVFPSLVQGKEAPKALLAALELAKKENLDTLIIGRGGGSSEDLGAFNDEALVRALSSFPCPTVSAVGHEIDVTLVDLVADKRVSTPTGAAIASVPDKEELLDNLKTLGDRIIASLNYTLDDLATRLDLLSKRACFISPSNIYQKKLDSLSDLNKRSIFAVNTILKEKKALIEAYSNRLKGLNPNSIIKRGYSITRNSEGKIINSLNKVKKGEKLTTVVADGVILSEVIGGERNNGK